MHQYFFFIFVVCKSYRFSYQKVSSRLKVVFDYIWKHTSNLKCISIIKVVNSYVYFVSQFWAFHILKWTFWWLLISFLFIKVDILLKMRSSTLFFITKKGFATYILLYCLFFSSLHLVSYFFFIILYLFLYAFFIKARQWHRLE